jgi:hypothetical protein
VAVRATGGKENIQPASACSHPYQAACSTHLLMTERTRMVWSIVCSYIPMASCFLWESAKVMHGISLCGLEMETLAKDSPFCVKKTTFWEEMNIR